MSTDEFNTDNFTLQEREEYDRTIDVLARILAGIDVEARLKEREAVEVSQ